MDDSLQGQVTEEEGDPDPDHVKIWIKRTDLPGVRPGQKVQVVPIPVPGGPGSFKLLLILPEAPPAP